MKTTAKVLIVDQRKAESDLLKKVLVKKGMAVAVAQSTKAGMKLAWKDCPDIMVIQAKIQKGGDALEICKSYRAEDSKFRHVPILLMVDSEDYIANSLFENPRWSLMDAFDGKPYGVKAVINTVEKAINETLKNTFVILFGYYKEEKDETVMAEETHLAHRSA